VAATHLDSLPAASPPNRPGVHRPLVRVLPCDVAEGREIGSARRPSHCRPTAAPVALGACSAAQRPGCTCLRLSHARSRTSAGAVVDGAPRGGGIWRRRVEGTVTSIKRLLESGFGVETSDGTGWGARRVLVTTRLVDELPDIPGVRDRWGRDVVHCQYCFGGGSTTGTARGAGHQSPGFHARVDVASVKL